METIYFDHAASTPMLPEAITALSEACEKAYANPSAKHILGQKISKKLEECRKNFLSNANSPKEFNLIFTGSATEANNMIFHSIQENEGLVYHSGDHPSLSKPAKSFGDRAIDYAMKDDVAGLINENTKWATLSHVNSSSGELFDIKKIAADLKAKNPDIHIHVDASQSFGKIPVDISEWQIDSMAICAHKMGGPKGIAALFYRRGCRIKPLLCGGPHESGLRASTPAFPLVYSWAVSLRTTEELNEKNNRVKQINDRMRTKMADSAPSVIFPFVDRPTSPYILTVLAPGAPSDMVLRQMEEFNMVAATSSACSSQSFTVSSTFAAIGIEDQYHGNVIRISFSHLNTDEEVDRFVEKFAEIYNQSVSLKA